LLGNIVSNSSKHKDNNSQSSANRMIGDAFNNYNEKQHNRDIF